MSEFQIIVVGDEALEFPLSMTDDEIAQALQTEFGPPTEAPPFQVSGTPVSDALESAQALPGGVVESVTQGLENYTTTAGGFEGTENPVSAAANVIRPALDVVGQVAGVGADAWMATYGQIPGVSTVLENVANSDIAKKGIELADKGMKYWDQFATEHPVEAAVIKDAGVLAEVLPVTPKGSSALAKTARRLKAEGNTVNIEKRREGIAELITPENKVGEGDTSETGGTIFNRKTEYKPDPYEDTIIKTMETIDTIDPDRSFAYNIGKTTDAIEDLQGKTEKILKSQHRTKIDTSDLVAELEGSIENIRDIPGYHALRGDAEAIAKDYLEEATRILKDAKKTPMGLLEARREFDRIVNEGGNIYGTPSATAKKVAATHIRNMMNDKLLTSIGAKEGDVVYDLLNRQHNLLKGRDILKGRKATEANSSLGRVFDYMKDSAHLPSTLLALYATGSTGAGLVLGSSALAGTGVVAGLGYGGYRALKALKGPDMKRKLGSMLTALDKQLKGEKDSTIKAELMAARVVLVEALKTPADELEKELNAEAPQQEP